MGRLFECIQKRWRDLVALLRRGAGGAPSAIDPDEGAMRFILAGRLCAEARLALVRHAVDEADACLARAAELDPTHPEWPDLSARVQLTRGDLVAAHRVLDRATTGNASRRLLRLLLRMSVGDAAGAHLELNEWSRRSDCPPGARTLAAWLYWRIGQSDAARRCLAPLLRGEANSRALRLAALIEHEAGQPAAMQAQLARLRSRFAHRTRSRAFLSGMDDQQCGDTGITREQIDQLVGELCEQPQVIPTLVAAQRWTGRTDRVDLLRRAIGRVAETLAEPYIAIEAMAELSMRAGDLDEAQRWARRGLAINPMSAKLALVLDQVEQAMAADTDQPTSKVMAVGAFGVLRRVADACPQYSDVQRALVERYRRAGMSVLADRHIERWLDRSPDDKIANALASEAAA